MAIYQIDNNEIVAIKETSFAERGLKERTDLQRLLKKQVDIISPDTLVIAEEFGEWEESRRRIDLLGIDKAANIVVIELKRTEDGGHMELQAIRYAAMVSTLTFDRVVDIYGKYLKDNDLDDDPRDKILEFLEWDEADEDQFGQDVRIILASAEFSKELTTAVMWLNERNLDIRCVRMKPYKDGTRTLLDVQTVIPLPEAEAYQVQIREKQQKERQSRKSSKDFTRYDVTVNGQTAPNQPKRGVMFHVIKPIIDSGVQPEQIAEIISWRKNNLFYQFNDELDEEEVVARLAEEDKGGAVPRHRRYFSKEDELFHVDGKTYILTNQWGLRTLEAVELLKSKFANLGIDVVPVKNNH
ncbi:MAG: hypothetical protein OEY89_14230 [Gammaproteobacteria bacterium]|nr:hypothetical protein [Gammaproteobacteria bacterium]